jgi:integrase/recombinase XerD
MSSDRIGVDQVLVVRELRGAFIMAALDAGVPLRDVQLAARHADPRTTTIYDRRRENFDRHAAYVVVAFVAGA